MADTLEYILKLQADSFVGGANKGKDALGRFKREAGDADSVVNKLQSRMASITTKFAAFGAAAAGGIGLAALIRRGFEFNKTMGDSEIAISKVLQQFQGLDAQASKTAAADAIAQIAELEPKAAGSLKDLTEGFLATVSVAQGLGISVKDNIDLVGMFANAMGNAKIPAEQLAQEMRSILTANIGADSTLAKVLTISNEDIEKAREAGNVVQFLKDKIGTLGEAGDSAEVTFSSLQSSIDKALGEATRGMFSATVDGAKSLTEVINEGAGAWTQIGEAGGTAISALIEGLAALAGPLTKTMDGLGVIGENIGVVAGFASALIGGATMEEAGKSVADGLAQMDEDQANAEAAVKAKKQAREGRIAEAQRVAAEKMNAPEHIGLDEINRLFEEEGKRAAKEAKATKPKPSGTKEISQLTDNFYGPAGGPDPRPATDKFKDAIAKNANTIQVAEQVRERERDSAFDGKRRKIYGYGSGVKAFAGVNPELEAAGEAKARVTRREAAKQAKEQAARAAEPRWDLVEKIADIMGGIKGA